MTTDTGTTGRAFPSARWKLSDWPLWRFKYLEGVQDLRVTELGYLLACDMSRGYRRFLLNDNGAELNVDELGGRNQPFETSLPLPVHGTPDQTNERIVHYRLMQFIDGNPIDWDHRIPPLSDDEWATIAADSNTDRKHRPPRRSYGPVGTQLDPAYEEPTSQMQAMIYGELLAAAVLSKDRQAPAVIPYPHFSADVGGYTFTRLPDRWAVERSVRGVACISCAARGAGVVCVLNYDGTRAYADTDVELARLYRIARHGKRACGCPMHTDSRAIGAMDMRDRAIRAIAACSGGTITESAAGVVSAALMELPLVPQFGYEMS